MTERPNATKRKKNSEADRALRFLADFADDNKLYVSLVDLKALAVGFVDSIPVVTDDTDMTTVARAHDIECWGCIKLLKLMCTSGRIDEAKVAEVLEYLRHENDLPMSLDHVRKEYKEYFAKDCPI